MNPNTQTPERDSLETRPYLLKSRIDIAGELRQLLMRHITFNLFFKNDARQTVARVVALNTEAGTMVLEHGAEGDDARLLKTADDVVAVGFSGAIKLQFRVEKIAPVKHEGKEAIRAAIPGELMRLQRRSDFRVPTPVADPVTCSVGIPGEGDRRVELTVIEMSCGGVGMMVDAGRLPHDHGMVFEDVELRLSKNDVVNPQLELRHISELNKDGKQRDRLGFAFVRLSGQNSKVIQQYVMAFDRRRNKR